MNGATLISHGCRLNIAESEKIAAMLGTADDLIVVNSCAVTAEAVKTARQAIRRAKRERPDAEVVVTGCAAEIEPDMFRSMGEVTAVVPNGRKLDRSLYPSSPHLTSSSQRKLGSQEDMPIPPEIPAFAGMTSRIHARTFLPVQNGCDHRCTFCIIPYGRGPSRSLPAGGVIEEIKAAVANGTREVVLTGVDLTAYGADLPGRPSLGLLVARILRHVPELPRLRLSSLDPCEVDEALFALIAHEPRIMPHLHLSLQAGDDLILKRMKRRHSRAQAVALVARLKAIRPGLAIGADLIAGFPTEDDGMFANTLALVDDCDVALAHIFPYSPRAGTPAARMPQVDRAVVRRRAALLREAGARRKAAWLGEQIGTVQQVLVELDGISGHAENFARVLLSPSRVREALGLGPHQHLARARGPTPTPSLKGRGLASANTILPVRITGVDGDTLLGMPA